MSALSIGKCRCVEQLDWSLNYKKMSFEPTFTFKSQEKIIDSDDYADDEGLNLIHDCIIS
jgi:hypothetical protein